MSNMSYCAFENTYGDLRQCLVMLIRADDEGISLRDFIESRSSREEGRAVEKLIAIAEEIISVAEDMAARDEEFLSDPNDKASTHHY